jgi:hypothetical protein
MKYANLTYVKLLPSLIRFAGNIILEVLAPLRGVRSLPSVSASYCLLPRLGILVRGLLLLRMLHKESLHSFAKDVRRYCAWSSFFRACCNVDSVDTRFFSNPEMFGREQVKVGHGINPGNITNELRLALDKLDKVAKLTMKVRGEQEGKHRQLLSPS